MLRKAWRTSRAEEGERGLRGAEEMSEEKREESKAARICSGEVGWGWEE